MHAYIARQQQRFNTLATIHRLPNELLLRVFRLSLDLNLSDYCYNALWQLAQVCKSWAALIKASPGLWDQVSATHSSETLETSLHRSKDVLLDVSACRSATADLRRKSTFLSRVIRHSLRWRSYTDHSLHSLDANRLSGLSLPFLSELVAYTRPTVATHLDLFSQPTDRLRNLQLRGVTIPWSLITTSRLTTLELSGIPEENGPTFANRLDILRSSPQLRRLLLHDVAIKDVAAETSHSSQAIDLPDLELFSVVRPAYSLADGLFERLCLPDTAHAELRLAPASSFGFDLSSCLSVLERLTKTFTSILERAPFASIILSTYEVTFAAGSGGGHERNSSVTVKIYGRLEWIGPMIEWYIGVLDSTRSVPELKVQLAAASSFSTIKAVLDVTYHVGRLELEHVSEGCATWVLRALAEPIHTDDGETFRLRWLQSVVLQDSPIDPDTLRDFLRARCWLGRRLETVLILGHTLIEDEDMPGLEAIAGRGVIAFNPMA